MLGGKWNLLNYGEKETDRRVVDGIDLAHCTVWLRLAL